MTLDSVFIQKAVDHVEADLQGRFAVNKYVVPTIKGHKSRILDAVGQCTSLVQGNSLIMPGMKYDRRCRDVLQTVPNINQPEGVLIPGSIGRGGGLALEFIEPIQILRRRMLSLRIT